MKPQLSAEIEEQLRIKMAEELHIDWAFKDVHGKPDTIIITGTPKGSYETDYNLFVENMAHFLATALEEQSLEIEKLIEERDYAEMWADNLASRLAPRNVLGEHSNVNNPWENAMEYTKPIEPLKDIISILNGKEKK